MSNWKTFKLGDLCIINSKSYSKNDNWDFVNYLDTGNITNNQIDKIQRIDLKNEKLPSRAKRKVKNNSIIYSTVRPNQCHFGIIKNQPQNFLVSTGFAVIDVDESIADSDFIYYYLTQSNIIEGLHSIAEQSVSAYPSIKPSDIADLVLLLPSLEIQKRVSNILCSLDDKIELNNQINKNLEQQAQAIFKSWFIDSSYKQNWTTIKFSDLIEDIVGGDWGKDTFNDDYKEMVYCIRGADIPELLFNFNKKIPIRYILSKNFNTKKLTDEDIIIEISGGSPTQSTGRTTIIPKLIINHYDNRIICSNFCRVLKPKNDYSLFLYFYLQHFYDRKIFFLYENGTTGIKNLNLSDFLENEEIILPPKGLINKFNEICKFQIDSIVVNSIENEKLKNIIDSLLPKLMSGEIEVSDVEV